MGSGRAPASRPAHLSNRIGIAALPCGPRFYRSGDAPGIAACVYTTADALHFGPYGQAGSAPPPHPKPRPRAHDSAAKTGSGLVGDAPRVEWGTAAARGSVIDCRIRQTARSAIESAWREFWSRSAVGAR